MVKKITLSALYRAWKAAERAYKDAQGKAIGDLAHGAKVDDPDATLTVVRGTTRTANVEIAKAILKPHLFRQVTETKVNLSALDALKESGKVTAEEYDRIVKVTNNAPYLKVTLH